MRKGPDYDKRKISVVVYDTYIPQWLTRQICSKNKPKLNTKYKAQHVKYIILFLFSFLTEWNSWSVYYIIFVFYFLQNGIAGPFIILFCFLFLTEWNSWSVLVRCWNNDKYIYISNILCTV